MLKTERWRVRLAVWLLLLLGQRVVETTDMEWSELSARFLQDEHGGEWVADWNVPAERRKQGTEWTVPLPASVVELICRETGTPVAALTGEIVRVETDGAGHTEPPCVGRVIGLGPRSRAQWIRRLQKKTKARGMAAWQLRDLRRSCATGLAGLGYSDELCHLVLGNARPRLTRTYQTDPRLKERRAALARWALRVEQLDPAQDPFARPAR